MHDRFFDSTRGKIVGALRSRGAASAFDLASEFALSPNAIRQQLVILERDGLVIGKSVRRGKTKPTHEYSLTTQADRYFPQAYDRMLGAVLREVRLTQGDAGVAQVFSGIAKRVVGKMAPALEGKSTLERLEAIADNIRGSGVAVDVEEHGDTIVLREHNCPYANVVSEHPECCTVIHSMLDEVVSPKVKQTESLATGGAECRFEVASGHPGANVR
jgi:predicted ArsR family transcriptional regulator